MIRIQLNAPEAEQLELEEKIRRYYGDAEVDISTFNVRAGAKDLEAYLYDEEYGWEVALDLEAYLISGRETSPRCASKGHSIYIGGPRIPRYIEALGETLDKLAESVGVPKSRLPKLRRRR